MHCIEERAEEEKEKLQLNWSHAGCLVDWLLLYNLTFGSYDDPLCD